MRIQPLRWTFTVSRPPPDRCEDGVRSGCSRRAARRNPGRYVFRLSQSVGKSGIPPADILRAWTTEGYELLGIAKQQGPIAPGMAGDMIAVPENPLKNIYTLRKVDFVMKDGQIVRRP